MTKLLYINKVRFNEDINLSMGDNQEESFRMNRMTANSARVTPDSSRSNIKPIEASRADSRLSNPVSLRYKTKTFKKSNLSKLIKKISLKARRLNSDPSKEVQVNKVIFKPPIAKIVDYKRPSCLKKDRLVQNNF